MTNPQGYMFISYRGTELPAVLRLRSRFGEFGIPVWHDKDSMPPGMLEEGIADALGNEACAGAIVWLSKDVAESAAIQRIELPAILRRIKRGDEFLVVFCLADDLTFESAQATLLSSHFNIDLHSFLCHPVPASPEDEDSIKALASLVLEKRLQLIDSRLAGQEALRIHIAGRSAPPTMTDHALVIDNHPLFSGRFATEDHWQSRILPALDLIASSIVKCAPKRAVVVDGTPQLSLALALGYALRTPRGLQAEWLQVDPESATQQWGLESPSAPEGFLIEHSTDLISGQNIAILIGVTNDPGPAFDASAGELPRFGAVIRVTPLDREFPARIAVGSEVSSLTQAIIRRIRSVVNEHRLEGSLHFFIAGPAGLAFLLGRQLNTFGKIHCYEHEAVGPIGLYRLGLAMET